MRKLAVLMVGILVLGSSARGMTRPKEHMIDEMKGFYGLIEGVVSSKEAAGFTLEVAAAKPWRDSSARAAETVVGRRLFIAFGRQGRGRTVNPVQRDFIHDRVTTGQDIEVAVHDDGDGALSMLALSRSHPVMDGQRRRRSQRR